MYSPTKLHVSAKHKPYSGYQVPLEAWSGPEGFRKFRFPDFITTAQDDGRLSVLRTGRLYSFMLEAESIPGT